MFNPLELRLREKMLALNQRFVAHQSLLNGGESITPEKLHLFYQKKFQNAYNTEMKDYVDDYEHNDQVMGHIEEQHTEAIHKIDDAIKQQKEENLVGDLAQEDINGRGLSAGKCDCDDKKEEDIKVEAEGGKKTRKQRAKKSDIADIKKQIIEDAQKGVNKGAGLGQKKYVKKKSKMECAGGTQPAIISIVDDLKKDIEGSALPKKRGRKPKAKEEVIVVVEKKKRGRKPKDVVLEQKLEGGMANINGMQGVGQALIIVPKKTARQITGAGDTGRAIGGKKKTKWNDLLSSTMRDNKMNMKQAIAHIKEKGLYKK